MRGIGRLEDPDVLLRVMLLQLLIVFVEFAELVRQDVGVWNEVPLGLSIAFLHPDDVKAKTVLARNFMTLREVVDLLILIEAFVQVTLATT